MCVCAAVRVGASRAECVERNGACEALLRADLSAPASHGAAHKHIIAPLAPVIYAPSSIKQQTVKRKGVPDLAHLSAYAQGRAAAGK